MQEDNFPLDIPTNTELNAIIIDESNKRKYLAENSNENYQMHSKLCQNCDAAEALILCEVCEFLCQKCDIDVHALKIFSKHCRRSIHQDLPGDNTYCKIHPKRPLDLFCKSPNCRYAICAYCNAIGDHKGHDVSLLTEEISACVDIHKNNIIPALENTLKLLNSTTAQLTTKKEAVNQEAINAEININNYFQMLMDNIMNRKQILLTTLKNDAFNLIAMIDRQYEVLSTNICTLVCNMLNKNSMFFDDVKKAEELSNYSTLIQLLTDSVTIQSESFALFNVNWENVLAVPTESDIFTIEFTNQISADDINQLGSVSLGNILKELEFSETFLGAYNGDVELQYKLGMHYMSENTIEEGIKWVQLSAQKGFAKAQHEYGICLQKGIGVPVNKREALKWFELAELQGHNEAIQKARMLRKILHVKHKNPINIISNESTECDKSLNSKVKKQPRSSLPSGKNEIESLKSTLVSAQVPAISLNAVDFISDQSELEDAIKYYKISAEKGDVSAQVFLGLRYYDGVGIRKNRSEAIRWFKLAANNGNSEAMFRLGCCYLDGEGIIKDILIGIHWLQEACKVDNNSDALLQLGHLYRDGKGVEMDFKKAFEYYKQAADQSHAEAMHQLGGCYEHGAGVSKNVAEAFKWYKLSAEKNNIAAQNSLGVSYHHGIGCAIDLEEATKWYIKSANQGFADAQYNLGLCYEEGCGVEKDFKLAWHWYQAAVAQNNVPALLAVAAIYEDGIDEFIDKDLVEACKYYRIAAENKHPMGLYKYGECHEFGRGKGKNMTEAASCYAEAAELGNMHGQCGLGKLYFRGEGVEQNYSEAVRLLKQAAEQGLPEAIYHLGQCYEYGFGVKKSPLETVQLYRQAAEGGDKDAQYSLGLCFYKGENGVSINYFEAFKWFLRSAMNDNDDAMGSVGDCYYFGYGITKNYELAAHWYQLGATKHDHPHCQNGLGCCYDKGHGLPQNHVLATAWYKKAAEQGFAEAQNSLGYSYDCGEGIEKNTALAFKWYLKSAEQNNSDAQNNVGEFYLNGLSVKRNYETAVHWFKKSAELGNKEAMINLSKCYFDGLGVKVNQKEGERWKIAATKCGRLERSDRATK